MVEKKPNILKRAWAAWKRFGQRMAEFVGVLIFAVLYFVAFAPLAAVMKVLGKRFLPSFTGEEATYYHKKEEIQPTREYLQRQW